MVIAKCTRCLGSAEGKTLQEARDKLNHAPGLSRGIKCGDNYNCVVEVKDETKKSAETVEKPKEEIKSVEKKISTPVEKPKKSKYY